MPEHLDDRQSDCIQIARGGAARGAGNPRTQTPRDVDRARDFTDPVLQPRMVASSNASFGVGPSVSRDACSRWQATAMNRTSRPRMPAFRSRVAHSLSSGPQPIMRSSKPFTVMRSARQKGLVAAPDPSHRHVVARIAVAQPAIADRQMAATHPASRGPKVMSFSSEHALPCLPRSRGARRPCTNHPASRHARGRPTKCGSQHPCRHRGDDVIPARRRDRAVARARQPVTLHLPCQG